MIVETVEGPVGYEQWERLTERFVETFQGFFPQAQESYLVQDKDAEYRWRIITVWRSLQAYDEYRKSSNVAAGVQVFRAIGTDPAYHVSNAVRISRFTDAG